MKERTYLESLIEDGHFQTKDEMMNHILLKVLGFESTEERKCDRLDFKEISITCMKRALDAVYLAGQMSVNR